MWLEVAKLNAIMFRLLGVTERHIAVKMTVLTVPFEKEDDHAFADNREDGCHRGPYHNVHELRWG